MSDRDDNLARSWVWVTIGELTEPGVEQASPKGNGDFLYVDITSIDNRLKRIVNPKTLPVASAPSRARQRLKANDVLVSMTRPNLNAVAILPSEFDGAIGSTGFDVLRTQWIEPHWLFYFVRTDDFITAMTRLVQGVLYPAVRPKDIRSHSVPVPPRAEQRRIVEDIEKQFTRLEAGVAALRRVQANLKRYRAAVLKAAVGGRLVPTEAELARREGRSYEPASELLKRILAERRARWEAGQFAKRRAAGKESKDDKWRGKYSEPASPDLSSLPSVPEGWVWTSVECLGVIGEQSVLTGPFGTTMGKNDFVESGSGVPVLTIGCLEPSKISLKRAVAVVPEKAKELERYRLREGDLVFSRMASVGRAGVVGAELSGALFNYHIMRLRLSPRVILPKFFIAYAHGSPQVGAYTRDVNHGVTRPGINTDQLLAMPVVLAPLAEQRRIVAEVERRLSVIDELETQAEANLRRAERLRQAILKRAFQGKLVPQDTNDEPASVLLERIRAERSKPLPRAFRRS
jgi:type I restriction enzyme S subunit